MEAGTRRGGSWALAVAVALTERLNRARPAALQAKAAAGAAEVGEGEEEDLGENQHGRANKPAAAAAGGKAGAKKGSSGGSRAAGKGAVAAKAGGGRAKRQKG